MENCTDCLVFSILWLCSLIGWLASVFYMDCKYAKLKKKQDKIDFENMVKNTVISAMKEVETNEQK